MLPGWLLNPIYWDLMCSCVTPSFRITVARSTILCSVLNTTGRGPFSALAKRKKANHYRNSTDCLWKQNWPNRSVKRNSIRLSKDWSQYWFPSVAMNSFLRRVTKNIKRVNPLCNGSGKRWKQQRNPIIRNNCQRKPRHFSGTRMNVWSNEL